MSGTTRRVVSALYFIALAVFVVWYVGTLDFAALAGTRPSVPWLLLASAIGLCFRYWGVYTWRAMLRGLGADDPGSWNTMSYVYAKAWLGRYLPGKVGWILLWLIGISVPVLLALYLVRGCT